MQEVAKEVDLIAEALNFVQSVAVVIGESQKIKTWFKLIFCSNEVETKNEMKTCKLPSDSMMCSCFSYSQRFSYLSDTS